MLQSGERLQRDFVIWHDLVLHQWASGYHFNRDSVVLARFVERKLKNANRQLHGVDLGTGSGILSLILLRAFRGLETQPTIIGLEKQLSLTKLARINAFSNQMAGRFKVVGGDVRGLVKELKPNSADFVVCNPPYYRKGSGRLSDNLEKAKARHMLAGDLEDFLVCAHYLLQPSGVFFMSFLGQEEARVRAKLDEHGFRSMVIRRVLSFADSDPAIVLFAATKSNVRSFVVEPPLVYRLDSGQDSQEVQQIYGAMT